MLHISSRRCRGLAVEEEFAILVEQGLYGERLQGTNLMKVKDTWMAFVYMAYAVLHAPIALDLAPGFRLESLCWFAIASLIYNFGYLCVRNSNAEG
ncbi:hypothetical protein MRB53_009821 [Persea americana]|uniref:Uncharacterized protein n=1 Tax=Persea americana TaxID=3435 RepID=A0ACC2LQ45_PERAE|nr:hypothetical protein MRB53_009821 [Persea americana]